MFAESESIDLELNRVFDGGSTVFIDDAGCMLPTIPCCPLVVFLNDEYELCPNEPTVFDASFQDESGSVTIEWTSDPSDAIDYLSDVNAISSTFEYVYGDNEFDGITYIFTLTVQDDECQQIRETEVIKLLDDVSRDNLKYNFNLIHL